MLYIFLASTLVGIAIKVWAIGYVKRVWQASMLYHLVILFIFLFLGQSTFELMLYFFSEHNLSGVLALRGYYVFALLIVALLPFLMATFTRQKFPAVLAYGFSLLVAGTLLLLVSSDRIIAGASSTGIALTRVAGSLYWMFQLSVLFSIGYSLYLLYRARKFSDGFLKVRTNNILLSFLLVAVYVVGVLVAMQFVENINAVGLLPVCLAFFIFGVVDNVCSKEIVDYSYWVPFSKKRRQLNQLVRPLIAVKYDGMDADIKKEYNAFLANHALELFNGNQTKAAEWLNVSQSWVSRNKG